MSGTKAGGMKAALTNLKRTPIFTVKLERKVAVA